MFKGIITALIIIVFSTNALSTRKKFPVSWIFKIIKREGVELKVA